MNQRIKIGVMGSAEAAASPAIGDTARVLAEEIARRQLILLTGATTGLIHSIGKTARAAGAFHIGVSPGANHREHTEYFKLPVDACDAMIYTGFGLKGRNVVLVRSSDIVIIVSGAMGSLNEFTIAYDEGKTIGCLSGTGGVADEAGRIVAALRKPTKGHVIYDSDPKVLVDSCLKAHQLSVLG